MGCLANGDIERYAEDGYLVLRAFFDRVVVEELRDATAEILCRAKRGTRGIGFDPWTTAPGDPLNPNRVYYTPVSKIGLINAYRAVDCIDLEERNTFKADNIPITRGGKVLARTHA